ncbi:MAG: Crp/Fnr family transcriptional regulator [Bacilli bacterium]|jgi:CRP-like cAMP-binding protein|nr:Crp/Fnr family transcriptional regulator [Bacilli bacterium]
MNVYNHPLLQGHTIDCDPYITTRSYKKDEIIHVEGETCDELSLVIQGDISIYTYTYYENEYAIAHLEKDGLFGQFLIFADDPVYLGNVVSLSNATIIIIKRVNLLELLTKDKQVLTNFLRISSNSVLNIQNRVKILSQKSIKESIMFYFEEIIKKTKTNVIFVKSKERLAEYLNIPRPSLSRALIELKALGIIEINGKYITIKE